MFDSTIEIEARRQGNVGKPYIARIVGRDNSHSQPILARTSNGKRQIMIDLSKYDTATEAAKEAKVNRRTLADAMTRGDEPLEVEETYSGGLLVSIRSAKKWAKKRPKPGPKSKD